MLACVRNYANYCTSLPFSVVPFVTSFRQFASLRPNEYPLNQRRNTKVGFRTPERDLSSVGRTRSHGSGVSSVETMLFSYVVCRVKGKADGSLPPSCNHFSFANY